MAKRSGLSFYKRKKKISSQVVKEILSWVFGILVSAFLAIVLVYLYGMTTSVVGVSMAPDLLSEQEILIDRFRYVFLQPARGDVVLFLPNGNENSHYYTKRVVARPGDTLIISGGILYVNGEPSELIDDKILEPGIAVNEISLAMGEYFVMGDDPSSSEDSRSADIGPVSEDDIIGRVWFALPKEGGRMHFVKAKR